MTLRLLTLFIVLYSLFFILTPRANAQFQNPNYLNTNPDVPQNLTTYTQSVFINVASATTCILVGIDPINSSNKCLGVDTKTGKIGYAEGGGGLIGITGNMIAMTFEIPVSSTHYGKYLADNFGIVKKTYAQTPEQECAGTPPESFQSCLDAARADQRSFGEGVGFGGLKPILEIWKTLRNIVYIFFVLIFVIIGLGIMFRIRIDPRTVMTLQNQIPKIIIALILVTFSYAIVGFLIDLMYVFMYLVYNTLSPNLADVSNFNPTKLQGSNPLSAVGFMGGVKIAIEASSGLGGIIGSLFDGTTGRVIAAIIGAIIGTTGFAIPGVGAIVGTIATVGLAAGGAALGGKLFGIIGGIIAFIVIAVTLLVALFRLWIILLKAYIYILINTVLAPFWIPLGLIPGSGVSFGTWFRTMIANLSVFPATLVMFLLGKLFIDAFGANPSAERFVPPFVGNPGNASQFGALIGLGVILLTPQVVTIIRQAIKAPENKLVTEVGRSVGAGAGLAGGATKDVASTAYTFTRGVQVQHGPGFGAILSRFFR